jgi:hypothetical protein
MTYIAYEPLSGRKNSESDFYYLPENELDRYTNLLESALIYEQLGRVTDMPQWYEMRETWNLS